jgi:hypothetical protein
LAHHAVPVAISDLILDIGRKVNQDAGLDIQTQDAMKEHIEAYHERR